MDEGMTPEEAAEQLGVSGDWIRKLCRDGRIPGARRYGRSWLIPPGAKIEATGLGRPLRTTLIPQGATIEPPPPRPPRPARTIEIPRAKRSGKKAGKP